MKPIDYCFKHQVISFLVTADGTLVQYYSCLKVINHVVLHLRLRWMKTEELSVEGTDTENVVPLL